MSERLLRLRQDLGPMGWLSIALIGLAAAFAFLVVKPLEARNAALAERAAQLSSGEKAPSAAGKVASVYGFLQQPEQTTDWLAKLHGIGTATGVQLRSATYKTQPAEGRIVRYEIVLPVSGSYAQIRDFLKRSLAEIPVLSLDQLSLKRDKSALNAELRLTLHMVKP
ncbi:MAG TPA: GspMb/PilO family protein [Burkholderiales bacterium]|nr:GspMb/PilO family protein [Burkholderiales bacterium]